MFRAAGEPIKAPHHDYVKLPLPGVVHQYIKFGSRVFRAGLAHINVFANEIKSPSRAVGPQIAHLQLAALVFSADARVYSYSHELDLLRGSGKAKFCAQRVFVGLVQRCKRNGNSSRLLRIEVWIASPDRAFIIFLMQKVERDKQAEAARVEAARPERIAQVEAERIAREHDHQLHQEVRAFQPTPGGEDLFDWCKAHMLADGRTLIDDGTYDKEWARRHEISEREQEAANGGKKPKKRGKS